MRLVVDIITLLTIAFTVGAAAVLATAWPFTNLAQGELRCEGAGAVVIRIAGRDYAVNGLASGRYPPVQSVWNSTTYPKTDIDRLIVEGLTLCDWQSALRHAHRYMLGKAHPFPYGTPRKRPRGFLSGAVSLPRASASVGASFFTGYASSAAASI
jgi:hypothetical protein